ncbi:hypothetical protein BDA96_05G054300 [Sorghum bicolor]|uniref:Uncharacterized protein n=2 Tax=Sorghum bicolor TaxID=4558 RepID=A0A921QXZ6_SORBI|nr:hypothetical protein BDA96_05G054300 [Sorghum bicolor]
MTSLVLPQICSSPHPSVLAKLPVAVRSSPRAECRRRGLRNRWVNPSHHRPPFPTPWAAAAKIAALASRCTRTVAPSLVLTSSKLVDYIKRAADDLSDRPNILICSYWLATSIPIGCTWLDLSGRAAPCRHSPLSRQSTALAIGHTKMLAEDKKHRSLPTPTIILSDSADLKEMPEEGANRRGIQQTQKVARRRTRRTQRHSGIWPDCTSLLHRHLTTC